MAKEGRKPTPTAILRLRGSWRAKNRPDEPTLPPESPEIPAILADPVAQAEWIEARQILERMGVLTKADKAILAIYCDAWAEFVRTSELLGTDYLVGSEPNPLVKLKAAAWERLLKAAKEIGFTPSARTGIKVDHGNKKEKGKERFFAG